VAEDHREVSDGDHLGGDDPRAVHCQRAEGHMIPSCKAEPIEDCKECHEVGRLQVEVSVDGRTAVKAPTSHHAGRTCATRRQT